MQDARIHYKCSFKITIKDDDTSWTNVVVTIRDWVIGVINKYEGDAKPLRFSNLHAGGSWSLSTTKHLKVNAYREQGTSSEADPEFWTMGLEHSDSTNTFRIWRTDVGLHKLGTKQYQFIIAISHYLKANYMGEELSMPDPNVPRVTALLLNDKKLICTAEDQAIPFNAVYLNVPGQGQQLVKDIFTSTRILPYVVILATHNNDYYIPPSMAAQMLLGNAKVIGVGTDAQEEVNYFLKDYAVGKSLMYTCKPGFVRVYFPVSKTNVNDFKQHRFFLPEKLALATPEENIQIIARSLIRRVLVSTTSAIVTELDVKNLIRERRLRELRDRRTNENQDEYLKLLEEDNTSLTGQVAQLEALTKTTTEELTDYQIESEVQKDEIDDLNRRLKWAEEQLVKEVDELRTDQTNSALGNLSQAFRKLPSSLSDLIVLANLLYGSNLVFLESALDSSRKAEYKDLPSAWLLLRHINDTLHPLYFSESSTATIATEFESRTGFELALTEGKMTKNDNDVMRQRKFEYNGKLESFLPHLKLVKNNKHLRLHFFVDRDKCKIVIGHCGDHLDTAGTRRL